MLSGGAGGGRKMEQWSGVGKGSAWILEPWGSSSLELGINLLNLLLFMIWSSWRSPKAPLETSWNLSFAVTGRIGHWVIKWLAMFRSPNVPSAAAFEIFCFAGLLEESSVFLASRSFCSGASTAARLLHLIIGNSRCLKWVFWWKQTSSILQGWGFRVGYLYDPRGIRAAVTVRPIYPSFTVIWKKRTLVAKSTVENIIFLQLETGWTLENILSGTAKFGNNGWNTFKRKSWITHMQRKRLLNWKSNDFTICCTFSHGIFHCRS